MSKSYTALPEQIRNSIADELQRRPVAHLHFQIPAADAADPERPAAMIPRVLKDFQANPELPVSHLARYFKSAI